MSKNNKKLKLTQKNFDMGVVDGKYCIAQIVEQHGKWLTLNLDVECKPYEDLMDLEEEIDDDSLWSYFQN